MSAILKRMIRLSCDDGCASDVRVAELATKYGIECVFYWPVEWASLAIENGYAPLNLSDALMIASEHEVGSHTVTHRHLTKIPIEEAVWEINESKARLSHMFNRDIAKFCPPRGYTNEVLTDLTLKLYESQRLTKGKGLVHIHPNSGANNNKPWRDCIDENTTEIWGHSHEFDKYGLWDELEEFLSERTRT